MPVPSFHLMCLENRCIARDVWEFRLTKPEGFAFTAGQYVLFDVPHPENSADIQTRAFSIGSAPQEQDLLFLAKMKEGGRASRWIAERLREGTSVRTQGPFGRFVIRPGTRDLLCIATSSGIVPFRSQAVDLGMSHDPRRMDIVFGVRSEEDCFWKEEFDAIAQRNGNVFVHLTLSKPPDSWKGHAGRVQAIVPRLAEDIAKRDVYVCGNPDMTAELKKLCIETWGVPKGQVHVEGYV